MELTETVGLGVVAGIEVVVSLDLSVSVHFPAGKGLVSSMQDSRTGISVWLTLFIPQGEVYPSEPSVPGGQVLVQSLFVYTKSFASQVISNSLLTIKLKENPIAL